MESFFSQLQTTNDDKDNSRENFTKIQDLIETFPRENGWTTSRTFDLYQYQGFWCYAPFFQGILPIQQQFQAKSSDIVIATPPKTGTTWLKALATAIVTRQRFDDTTSPLLTKIPHDIVPFLEVDLLQESRFIRDPENPLISTHLPYTSLPNSIVQRGCKIVYIWRDAKDTFVSLWHFFVRYFKSVGLEPITMEEAFEMFCKGISFYGPYPDHILQYWIAKSENPDKILFLKYEEMMEDIGFYTKKLAEFLGYPFTREEEENQVLKKIIEMCSFEKLSNLEVNKTGRHREDTSTAIDNKVYFRKAQVGDWSNYLTDEMGARLDLIMEDKLKGTDLI